jgi:hypothetical protein
VTIQCTTGAKCITVTSTATSTTTGTTVGTTRRTRTMTTTAAPCGGTATLARHR